MYDARGLHDAGIEIESYGIREPGEILTPALAIYPEIVDANVAATLRLLDGQADRWRPHLKTAKLGFVMQRLVASGVTHFKCATSLELRAACESGAQDVLVAYPVRGATARRVREIAERFPEARVGALVERPIDVRAWAGERVGLFIDVDPGMNRTGIGQERVAEIVELAAAIARAGVALRGLHYYEGHLTAASLREREVAAHAGYDRLLAIVAALEHAGHGVQEVVTSGTPALPCALSYPGFRTAGFAHRVSAGTIVYGDLTSLGQLPREYGYRPAALVFSTVVSAAGEGRVTCDAGHKTVSADAGVPTCAVLGRPDLTPDGPSEEHLPLKVEPGATPPATGEVLYLVPRHVCPTVNNFDDALVVSDGRVLGVERVTARGRERPLGPSV